MDAPRKIVWMFTGKIVFNVLPSKKSVYQEKWFIFIILLFIVPASLSCSLPFVSAETYPNGYLVGKELVILLFVRVVGKMFCCVLCIFFPT